VLSVYVSGVQTHALCVRGGWTGSCRVRAWKACLKSASSQVCTRCEVLSWNQSFVSSVQSCQACQARSVAERPSFSGCMHALLGRLLAVGSLYWWAVRMSATSGCHAGFCLHGCCASGSTELETLTAWSQSGEATSVVRYCELQRCTAEPNVQTPCSQCSWTPNAVGRERS